MEAKPLTDEEIDELLADCNLGVDSVYVSAHVTVADLLRLAATIDALRKELAAMKPVVEAAINVLPIFKNLVLFAANHGWNTPDPIAVKYQEAADTYLANQKETDDVS